MLTEHRSTTTNNFKRFLRDHGLKIEVGINASGGGYSAYVSGAQVQTPTTLALELGRVEIATWSLNPQKSYSTPEDAMLDLALECQGGELFVGEDGAGISIGAMLPDLSGYSQIDDELNF